MLTGLSGLSALSGLTGLTFSFLPSFISGLALWLKADAGLYQESTFATPAVSDSDPVGGWQDQSGNGRHVIQATSTKRGTLKLAIQNGRAVIRFDGVDDFLQTSANFGLTGDLSVSILAVVIPARTSTVEAWVCLGNGSGGLQACSLTNSGVATYRLSYAGGQDYKSSAPVTLAAAQVTAVKTPGAINATSSIWKNGTLATDLGSSSTSTPNVTAAPLTLGAFWTGSAIIPVQGDIAEILVYSTALSTASRLAVEAYLKAKWGTP